MNQQITDKIIQMLDALQNSAVPLTNDAVKLALEVAHYNAMGKLLLGFTTLLLSIGMLIAGIYLIKRGNVADSENEEHCSDPGFPFWLCGGVLLFISLISAVATFSCLANIYNWVGIYNPQVYLAHQIMAKFISN